MTDRILRHTGRTSHRCITASVLFSAPAVHGRLTVPVIIIVVLAVIALGLLRWRS